MSPSLTQDQIDQYHTDGYLILEDVIDQAEVEQILAIWRADPRLARETKENANFDGDEGLHTRLVYRPALGPDAYSALAQSQRIVGPLEQIYSSPIDHYYSLNMRKDPNTGGWAWHQDYGYHYKEFFYPDFVSVMVALDPATRDNGCLRVVRGSSRLGRLEHTGLGSQLAADPQRVELALEQMEEVHCELSPGSALIFHGNALHASNANHSQTGRWSMVYAYVPSTNIWMLPEPPQMNRVEPFSDSQLREAIAAHADELNLASA
ncbi:MAG: phytanoyl-CoA dioxygenase family protein [Gemmatimonadetes bacterium]|jgi:ectoine hydroxylase-related dioxygenase (phytanoyl-CoA dioxygenase family)|nr:phytanoyl-CoA dioxygenase family protein [Gemmatimonadota bacterium]MBT7864306.1 phytanoyl-CoA dioxygenase family protein [Gemmatimonadota bacterium]